MAAKSNYFKESGLHTWHFHSVGKRKSPLAASACRPRGPAHTKSSYATCAKGFTEICGSFGFISLRTAIKFQSFPILFQIEALAARRFPVSHARRQIPRHGPTGLKTLVFAHHIANYPSTWPRSPTGCQAVAN